MATVIERVEAHYEVLEVEFGTVYKWRPASLLIECECEGVVSITGSETICDGCGAEHAATVEEVLEARPEDKGDHPWRYLQPHTHAGYLGREDALKGYAMVSRRETLRRREGSPVVF